MPQEKGRQMEIGCVVQLGIHGCWDGMQVIIADIEALKGVEADGWEARREERREVYVCVS